MSKKFHFIYLREILVLVRLAELRSLVELITEQFHVTASHYVSSGKSSGHWDVSMKIEQQPLYDHSLGRKHSTLQELDARLYTSTSTP